ncbi:unnamed protein product [Moneuplotes crassus]|uniref:Uncharacterized protein n=1 Tax=Euplotes crassus TaxID=5936 RepID=A0AAD1U9K8_EUPCR|nr:unnamed protein product [Moneuplotes crassus]
MGEAYSTLKWKFKGGKAYNEYALHQETERNNADILDAVCKQYYYISFRQKKSNSISMILKNFQDKQALTKIEKLAPKVEKLEYIAFHNIQKNDKKLNRLLGQLRVSELKRIYFDGNSPGSLLFSFYARNIVRFLPLAPQLIQIINFKVSHRDFGRVLVSCGSSTCVLFQACRIVINGFDYLDNVQPLIRTISLSNNTIIQPEEDNEYFDGLIQKMAESSLSGSLRQVSIWAPNSIEGRNKILDKKEYTIGDLHVCVY